MDGQLCRGNVEIAEVERHVDLVEYEQVVLVVLDELLSELPCFARDLRIPLGVLRVPREPFTHFLDLEIFDFFGHTVLTRGPWSLDELHHKNLETATDGTKRRAQGRRCLALSVARINDNQTDSFLFCHGVFRVKVGQLRRKRNCRRLDRTRRRAYFHSCDASLPG